MEMSSSAVYGIGDVGGIFLMGFKTLLVENEREICQMGYDLEDLETHSICKGATTYTSSGTTASPGGISTSIRRGWAMGKVQDMCMLYKKLGINILGDF
eukprot:15356293-Ditylum_brightwellii.AAC.1